MPPVLPTRRAITYPPVNDVTFSSSLNVYEQHSGAPWITLPWRTSEQALERAKEREIESRVSAGRPSSSTNRPLERLAGKLQRAGVGP